MNTTEKVNDNATKWLGGDGSLSLAMVLMVVCSTYGVAASAQRVAAAVAAGVTLAIMAGGAIYLHILVRRLRTELAAKDAEIAAQEKTLEKHRRDAFTAELQVGIANDAIKQLFATVAKLYRERTDEGARKARDEAALEALRLGLHMTFLERNLVPGASIWRWAPGVGSEEERALADLVKHRKWEVKKVLERAPDDIARHFLELGS